MKKTVLKISLGCLGCVKCKKCVMKTVAKLEGINEIKVDVEKGTLMVIGDVDPVMIVKELRKIGKEVMVDSVDSYQKEKPESESKPEPIPDPCKLLPPCCRSCQPVVVRYITYDDPNWCTIL